MRLRLSIVPLLAALAAFLCAGSSYASLPPTHQPRAAAAAGQYERAQKLQAKLEEQAGGIGTEEQYKATIRAYRRVTEIDPGAVVATPSLIAIGRLYEEMGRLFDPHYFPKAVETYRFLLRGYPHTRRGPEALYSIARLEEGPLGNPAEARRILQTIIDRYPSSDQADRARLEMANRGSTAAPLGQNSTEQPAAESNQENHPSEQASAPLAAAPPAEQTTGVGVSDRVTKASLPVTNGGTSGGMEGRKPARVHVIATADTPGYTQIMIRLDGPVKFRSARVANSQRVYFDLTRAYLLHPHGEELPIASRYVTAVRMAQNRPHVVRVVIVTVPGAAYSARLLTKPFCLVIDVGKPEALASASGGGPRGPQPAETRAELAPRGRISPASPMRDGATSLTRELGLKIARIVIDAGHGGFDTGTVGPTGVEEKTVCLDVAQRLGALVEKRLPGTEVDYTRDSDVFVPLQERTAIANRDKADLFVSIHANSSSDEAARGVETYFLNFTTSPEAMQVAARENALSQDSVHQLQDLLQKISLNDKVEESRELAADVDHSLVQQLKLGHVVTHDRGLKKAPFVVLIGAHMPSILAEISFLSNPTDERLLKTPRYRQRIAQGLFNGIQRYLASLNSLTSNAAPKTASDQR